MLSERKLSAWFAVKQARLFAKKYGFRSGTKYSVAQIVGFIKGKSAIQIARNFQGRKKNFVGQNFWARRYYVSTVGKDEDD